MIWFYVNINFDVSPKLEHCPKFLIYTDISPKSTFILQIKHFMKKQWNSFSQFWVKINRINSVKICYAKIYSLNPTWAFLVTMFLMMVIRL